MSEQVSGLEVKGLLIYLLHFCSILAIGKKHSMTSFSFSILQRSARRSFEINNIPASSSLSSLSLEATNTLFSPLCSHPVPWRFNNLLICYASGDVSWLVDWMGERYVGFLLW